MKEPFKMSEEFHKSFTDSLDMLESTPTKSTFKRAASIAACLLIAFTIAVIGADAAGVIDVGESFRMYFSQNPKDAITTIYEDTNSNTTEGVTAKVLQCIPYDAGDFTFNQLIVEFSSAEKNLNIGMYLQGLEVTTTEGTPLPVSRYSVLQDYELEKVKSTEELKKVISGEYVPKGIYSESDINSFMADLNLKYQSSFTDKIYLLMSVHGDIEDKEIQLRMNNLLGLNQNAYSPEDLYVAIGGEWTVTFTGGDYSQTKTFIVDKEYGGIHYNTISVSPVSVELTCKKTSRDFEGTGSNVHALRLKSGEIQPMIIVNGSSNSANNSRLYCYNNILDIENISGIFVGDDLTEIPLN